MFLSDIQQTSMNKCFSVFFAFDFKSHEMFVFDKTSQFYSCFSDRRFAFLLTLQMEVRLLNWLIFLFIIGHNFLLLCILSNFNCWPKIVSFTLLGTRYFCIPLHILELHSGTQLNWLETKWSVMDWMCVSLRIYMLKSTPPPTHVMVLGGDAFGRWLGHDGGAPWLGLVPL